MTVIVDHDTSSAEHLEQALEGDARVLPSVDSLLRHLEQNPQEDVAVLAPSVDVEVAFDLAETMRVTRPTLGIILVRRRFDTSLLTEAMRSGIREVVADRDAAALVVAVRRAHEVARKIREHEGDEASGGGHRYGRVLTVFAAKGGCGKTTVATNLAAVLAAGGRRQVCILDLDLSFGDVAIALQLFPAHTIADAVPLAGTLDEKGVSALLTPHSPGLTTLVAPVEPGTAETVPANVVSELLQVLRSMFDFVVVDTPPAFTDHVLAALDVSDLVLLMATLDIPALKNLKLTLETLELLNYPQERWRVVLNRADSKVGLSLSEVEKTLHVPIAVQVPSHRAVPASINRGVPIVLDDPNHPVSQSLRQFADRDILAGYQAARTSGAVPTAEPSTVPPPRRGLLRRRVRT
jgi:pilus assembly protein CpaE